MLQCLCSAWRERGNAPPPRPGPAPVPASGAARGARIGLLAPGLVDLLGGTVAAGVVGRGVVAEAIADALQQGRPLPWRARAPGPRGRSRRPPARRCRPPVRRGSRHPPPSGRRAALDAPRHRDRPLVVVDHEEHRQPPGARHVQRPRGNRSLLVAPSPQVVTATRCSPRMRNAEATPQACRAWVAIGTQMGKVLRRQRFGVVAAALVAAPVEGCPPCARRASIARRSIAVIRHQHVLGAHLAADGHADGFPGRGLAHRCRSARYAGGPPPSGRTGGSGSICR